MDFVVSSRAAPPNPYEGQELANPIVGEPATVAARAAGIQLPKHVWMAPVDKCDTCEKEISGKLGTFFFDAATKQGPWATMCETCFPMYSRGMIGSGNGQKYQLQIVNHQKWWVKVDG